MKRALLVAGHYEEGLEEEEGVPRNSAPGRGGEGHRSRSRQGKSQEQYTQVRRGEAKEREWDNGRLEGNVLPPAPPLLGREKEGLRGRGVVRV